jgi:hypothetical protein
MIIKSFKNAVLTVDATERRTSHKYVIVNDH